MEWLKQRIGEALSGAQPINRKLLLAVVVLVAAIALLISNFNSPTAAAVVVATAEPTSSVAIEPVEIYVHVVGEVKRPGVYQLDAGARVYDAVFQAQGLTDKAESASINLARPISDGEQIVVLKKGQLVIGSGAEGLTGSSFSTSAGTISLNSASANQLEALPGVGPALAGRLVDWRKANGGFKKKEDLLNVSGIGPKLFAGIKDLVTL